MRSCDWSCVRLLVVLLGWELSLAQSPSAALAQPAAAPAQRVTMTLPAGHFVDVSGGPSPVVEAALSLLASTTAEQEYSGETGPGLTISFDPPRELPLNFGGAAKDSAQRGTLSRISIATFNPMGPTHIAVQINGKAHGYTKHDVSKWIAFRRELDRAAFRRSGSIIPAVGEWSEQVHDLRARLSVDNARHPMISVFLELANQSSREMLVRLNADKIDFQFLDNAGAPVQRPATAGSAGVYRLRDFQLPPESTLKLNVTLTGFGVHATDQAAIGLRNFKYWRIKAGDFQPYQLAAEFAVEKAPAPPITADGEPGQASLIAVWDGRIKVPPVTVQAAPRVERPDEIKEFEVESDSATREAIVDKLNDLFQREPDVMFSKGASVGMISITAHESRHAFIKDLVKALQK